MTALQMYIREIDVSLDLNLVVFTPSNSMLTPVEHYQSYKPYSIVGPMLGFHTKWDLWLFFVLFSDFVCVCVGGDF